MRVSAIRTASGPEDVKVSPAAGPSAVIMTSHWRVTAASSVLWVIIISIHAACSCYYAFVSLVYHTLPTTILSTHVRSYHLAMDMKWFPLVVAFHAICALLHLGFVLEMLLMSARRRKLYFHRWAKPSSSTPTSLAIRSSPLLAGLLMTTPVQAVNYETPRRASTSLSDSLRSISTTASTAWDSTFGVTGLLGVGGKHFALLFLMREVIEAVLQSIQAYTLSKYVPRVWLNRSAVAIVAVSCWSTPAIRRLLSRFPRVELILCLLVDIVLDMSSSIGVPVALGMMSLPDYDPVTRDFNVLSSRVLFALAMLLSLDDVKLLAVASVEITRELGRGANTKQSAVVRMGRRVEKAVHVVLILWGFIILALHLTSVIGQDEEADLSDCMVRVRPWMATKPTCAAIEIDCKKHLEMAGTSAELEARWAPFDPQALTLLIVRNCQELHMPASIQSFPQLTGLSLYFSSGVRFQQQPSPGLLSRDFPQSVGAVVVAGTAFDKLPPDLHELWPRGMSLRIMGNDLVTLPEEVLQLEPVRLNLQYNQLTSVPAALFELPSLQWLELGFNVPLSALPEGVVAPSKALLELSFQATNVSSLPMWMQNKGFLSQVRVSASMTPLCTLLQAENESTRALASRICSAF
ncbi:hypothetical protein Gpo141_00003568 [Globisporangium polare]